MPAVIFILISVLLNVLGQLSLKLGTGHLGVIHFTPQPIAEIFRIFTNLQILSGLALYACSTVFWIAALSKSDLSYAYPFLSLGYILVILFSYLVLHENLSILRLTGMGFIMLGLIFIAFK